jgi:tRNA(Ile)-lysidine synthase
VRLDVLQKIIIFIQENSLLAKNEKVVVGVSGGPDSLALLHLFANHLCPKFGLPPPLVAHLNHQLRGSDSQADADFVQEIAQRWHLPVFVATKDVASLAHRRRQSVEEAARQIRYAFLWQVASEVGTNKVAVGHNADDQVETVLMHFLRGSGLSGLRGMLPVVDLSNLRLHPDDISALARPLEPVKLIRPLLEISRAEIEAYCHENNLTPRQDYSNQDITIFRNRLRHELIPDLERYNPNIRQVVQRTAKVVAADVEVLVDQLNRIWPSLIRAASPHRLEFDLQSWLALPLALKRSSLRRAVQTLRQSLRDLNFDHIETAIKILEKGDTGAKATLPQGLIIRLSYHTFTIASEDESVQEQINGAPQIDQNEILEVTIPGITPLPGGGWLLVATLMAPENIDQAEVNQPGVWEIYLDAKAFGQQTILRSRRPGDRFFPLGLNGRSKKVNEFMIDQKIPANLRDRIPLVVSNQQIIWICGYRPAEQARISDTTRQVVHLKFESINSD